MRNSTALVYKNNTNTMPLQKYTYKRITYFVDYRLKQFRSDTPVIRFVDFYDELGDRILCKMIRENVVDWSQLHI